MLGFFNVTMNQLNFLKPPFQMERQRLQAGVARAASIPIALLYNKLIVSLRTHRTATKVNSFYYKIILY